MKHLILFLFFSVLFLLISFPSNAITAYREDSFCCKKPLDELELKIQRSVPKKMSKNVIEKKLTFKEKIFRTLIAKKLKKASKRGRKSIDNLNNPFAILGLIGSVMSLLTVIVAPVFSIVLLIGGVACSMKALKLIKRDPRNTKGKDLAYLGLGLATLSSVLGIFFLSWIYIAVFLLLLLFYLKWIVDFLKFINLTNTENGG
jgi:hypothetical protein